MRNAVFTALAGLTALALACTGIGWEPEGGGEGPTVDRTPVVFVPGVTGTKLRDPRTERLVWGGGRSLLRPVDGGREIALPIGIGLDRGGEGRPDSPQAGYEPVEPIWQLGLFGVVKPVYRPLVERFHKARFRLGRLEDPEADASLFFFNYDWRYDNLASVRRLHRQLEALSEQRDDLEVDLVCQSNAAKICRWLVKYGALDAAGAERGAAWERSYRIRKLILVGASNDGALRALQQLIQGRSYVPVIGRRLRPETLFSIRPLFEDLPAERSDLFFDEAGETVEVDLFDSASWEEYEWSIFSREASERLRRHPRDDLFGSREDRLRYLQRQLDRARRIQLLLARDSDRFPEPAVYLMENESEATIDRALLTRETGRWRTWFMGDSRLDRDPLLSPLASVPGDGHASLASQRGLSPQETEALAGRASVSGGHFAAIVGDEALDALLEFLE